MPFPRLALSLPLFRSIALPVFLGTTVLGACADGSAGTGNGTGGEPEAEPTDTPEQAPTWTDAVDTLDLTQGQWLRVDVTTTDPQDDVVAVEIDAGALYVQIEDGGFSVRPTYETSDTVQIDVTLTDDTGNERAYVIEVNVTLFGWGDMIVWSDSTGPGRREHGTAIYDAASNSAFVFGGTGYSPQFTEDLFDFWRFDVDTETWTEVTPTGTPPASGASRRFAGMWGSGSGLLFGGYAGSGPVPYYDELYAVSVENDTLHFEVITQMNTPPARSLHAFAYDAETDRYVLFGGVSQNPGLAIYNDMWTMTRSGSSATWTSHSVLGGPTARYGSFTAVDEVAGRLFVFSGAQMPQSQSDPVNPARDSWMLDMRADPPAWTKLDKTGAPGRRNGCGISDPNGRLFVLGGTADGATTASGVFALDMRQPQEGFESLPINNDVLTLLPLRASGFGFATLDKVYCGFGNGDSGVHQDWLVLTAQAQ